MDKRWILGVVLGLGILLMAGGICGCSESTPSMPFISAPQINTVTPEMFSPTPTPTPPTTSSGFNPSIIDAAMEEAAKKGPSYLEAYIYSKHYGVSIEEAQKRFKLQRSFPGLATAIQENETDTFGGLWIQHEPQYRIVVAFTRDGDQTMEKYSAYITEEIAPYIEVRTVNYTKAELSQTQMDIGTVLGTLGIRFDSGLNITENSAEFRILESDQSKIEQAKQAGTLIIPDYVRIKCVTGLSILN